MGRWLIAFLLWTGPATALADPAAKSCAERIHAGEKMMESGAELLSSPPTLPAGVALVCTGGALIASGLPCDQLAMPNPRFRNFQECQAALTNACNGAQSWPSNLDVQAYCQGYFPTEIILQ